MLANSGGPHITTLQEAIDNIKKDKPNTHLLQLHVYSINKYDAKNSNISGKHMWLTNKNLDRAALGKIFKKLAAINDRDRPKALYRVTAFMNQLYLIPKWKQYDLIRIYVSNPIIYNKSLAQGTLQTIIEYRSMTFFPVTTTQCHILDLQFRVYAVEHLEDDKDDCKAIWLTSDNRDRNSLIAYFTKLATLPDASRFTNLVQVIAFSKHFR
ncbi:Aste57867_23329 [Aphanomyces stellatus]|uniref:Aste57867_23329 protein n=1 Tax=Aphanomyces stellatus TaxID=120398 RepID=A0A485LMU4_9STRA|nr:hypothetical protein As57867_023258 [Aphanomyces stellatus]VFT99974.1 Aste57867_23329 [Aphanomyces stellatus]